MYVGLTVVGYQNLCGYIFFHTVTVGPITQDSFISCMAINLLRNSSACCSATFPKQGGSGWSSCSHDFHRVLPPAAIFAFCLASLSFRSSNPFCIPESPARTRSISRRLEVPWEGKGTPFFQVRQRQFPRRRLLDIVLSN